MIFIFEQTAKDGMKNLGFAQEEVINCIRAAHPEEYLMAMDGDEILSFYINGKPAVAVVEGRMGTVIVAYVILNIITV